MMDSQSSAGFKSGWSSGSQTPSQKEDDSDMSDKDEEEEAEMKKKEEERRRKQQVAVTMLQDEPPKPADIHKEVKVHLSETETSFHIDIPSTCVADDDPNLDEIKAANKAYDKAIEVKIKEGADKFSDRNVQTLNSASKSKESQATPAITHDIGVDVTNFEIHDAIQELNDGDAEAGHVDDIMGAQTKKTSTTDALNNMSVMAAGGRMDAAKLGEATLQTKEFKSALMSMERIVVQNIYHIQQMMYRNMVAVPSIFLSSLLLLSLIHVFSYPPPCSLLPLPSALNPSEIPRTQFSPPLLTLPLSTLLPKPSFPSSTPASAQFTPPLPSLHPALPHLRCQPSGERPVTAAPVPSPLPDFAFATWQRRAGACPLSQGAHARTVDVRVRAVQGAQRQLHGLEQPES